MQDRFKSIITPKHFKLPELAENVFLFFIRHHFFMFREMVNGGKISSFGPAKRFDFTKTGIDYSVLGGFIGAPFSVIIAENAMVSGAKSFKAFGTAGCIGSDTIKIGEIHRPEKAWDDTGMIQDYSGSSNWTAFNYTGTQPSCGNIVSVNSFYCLTPVNLERYRSQSIEIIVGGCSIELCHHIQRNFFSTLICHQRQSGE